MFRTVATCVVVMMMGAGVLRAQDEPQGMPAKLALTIPEAIELAWKNNITSIRQQSALESSEAVKVGTRSTWMPTLSFDASWQRSQPAEIQQFLLSDSTLQTLVLSDTYRFGFSLRQPIFNSGGGSWMHVPRSASAQVSADEELLRSTRQSVALETKRLCYNLLKAQKLYDVQGNAVKRSIEQLETSKARYELGSASMSDFLKSKVQLGSDSLTLITRANDADIARSELNKFLALDVSRQTEVDVALDFEPYPLPSDTAVAAAVEKHPTVQAENYKLKRASIDLGGDRFQRLPSVDAFLNYGWFGSEFPGGTDEIWRTDAHTVGIQLNWLIFSGFSTSSRIRQSKVAKHQAEQEVAEARRTVQLDITKASLNLNAAGKRLQVADDQVESAQEDLKIAQEKYNLGAATILDILTAQVGLSEAETERIQAGYDYYLSIADLERSMGGGD